MFGSYCLHAPFQWIFLFMALKRPWWWSISQFSCLVLKRSESIPTGCCLFQNLYHLKRWKWTKRGRGWPIFRNSMVLNYSIITQHQNVLGFLHTNSPSSLIKSSKHLLPDTSFLPLSRRSPPFRTDPSRNVSKNEENPFIHSLTWAWSYKTTFQSNILLSGVFSWALSDHMTCFVFYRIGIWFCLVRLELTWIIEII